MSDFLPEDIVVDILSRLPAKSLIRFRCVSKVWNSLIASPTFISSHLSHSLSSNGNISRCNDIPPLIVRQCIRTTHTRTGHYKIFRDTEEGFDEYQELEFPLKSSSLNFYWLLGVRYSRALPHELATTCYLGMSYVKGLFCLYEQDSHFLWNPSIRKSLTLPKPRTKFKSRYDCRLGFGFDTRAAIEISYTSGRIALVGGLTVVVRRSVLWDSPFDGLWGSSCQLSTGLGLQA